MVNYFRTVKKKKKEQMQAIASKAKQIITLHYVLF
jgi:hypothetical protein